MPNPDPAALADPDPDWIAEEKVVAWLVRAYQLSGGAAEAEMGKAASANTVRVRVEIPHFNSAEVVQGLFREVKNHVEKRGCAGANVFDCVTEWNFDDLRWQIRQQLGEPRPAAVPIGYRRTLQRAHRM